MNQTSCFLFKLSLLVFHKKPSRHPNGSVVLLVLFYAFSTKKPATISFSASPKSSINPQYPNPQQQ